MRGVVKLEPSRRQMRESSSWSPPSAAGVGTMIGRRDGSWKRLSALRGFLSSIRRLQKRPSQSRPLALAPTTTPSSSHLCVPCVHHALHRVHILTHVLCFGVHDIGVHDMPSAQNLLNPFRPNQHLFAPQKPHSTTMSIQTDQVRSRLEWLSTLSAGPEPSEDTKYLRKVRFFNLDSF